MRPFSRICSALALALAGLTAMVPAKVTLAESRAVDLQLVLAVDVSGSVSAERFDLQRDGYAAAFRNRLVLDSVLSGPARAIAVSMVQWTGPGIQFEVVPWMRIHDAASAETFAAKVAEAPRSLFGGGTSISGVIDFCVPFFERSPYKAGRRIIDVSGDGSNNRGRAVTEARDAAIAAGIGINGLPILALEPDLDRYYQDNVIGGPGAFIMPAKSYEQFAEAIVKKLVAEIAGLPLGPFAAR